MSARLGRLLVRGTGLAGVAWGVVLLTRGEEVWRALDDLAPTPADAAATRVLGGRHVVQGALETLLPDHLHRTFVVVDLLHAASMVALAAADPDRRRVALVSGTVAACGAASVALGRALS